MRAPAVPLCFAFVTGIVSPSSLAAPLALSVASAALGGALWCATRSRTRRGTVLVVVAFAALGSAARALHDGAVVHSELRSTYERFGERVFSTPRLFSGTLRGEPELRVDRTLVSVDVETVAVGRRAIPARGGVRVAVRGERRASLASLESGARVRFWASVREPVFFNNPGSFDGARRLEAQHIDLLGSVKSGLLVYPVESAALPTSFVSRLRRFTIDRLAAELDPPERGVVAALVTGTRAELSPELIRSFQRAGIFHVMAISGAHVGIWIAFLYALGRWAGASTRATLVGLALLLPLYAVFCGGRAPVVRAVVMALLLIGARLGSVRAPSENALATAALVLLAWEPASLFDAGFQLTMGAMATIVVFYERIAERLTSLGIVGKPLAVSVAAQLGVMPIAAWHFHRLNSGSPVASLIAIPVAAAICILGVTLVVVSGVPVVSAAVSAAAGFAVTVLSRLAEVAGSVPGASIRVGAPSTILLVAYALALVGLASRSRRARAGGGVLLGILAVVVSMPRGPRTGALEIHALDVGHGDAIVLTLPGGGTVLIDGGGLPLTTLDVGESVVLPFLLELGVRRLDAVVVSHADFDHIGGLATVVSEIGVGELWQGHPDGQRAAYRELRHRARARGVPVRTLDAGSVFELGGARFEVLAARRDAAAASNNRSLVLRVGYAGRKILLTGDAEADLERELVRSGVDLRADVLKLAHHGSRSSTTRAFLDAVDPEIAVVSARRNRSRPLPSALVLHRLRERGIEYARTDRNGTVTVRIDETGGIHLSTYRRHR